ncbi:MAG TPA: Crp/Fnr family transcriptional regulator [Candidatus Baltobacteraceae bacterium]
MDILRPSLVRIGLKRGDLIFDRGEPLNRVLFPLASVISIVLDMSDGSTAEVGLIGREGMTGLSLALGQARANQRAVVQVPNGAECLDVGDFAAAVQAEPELKAFVLRYAQATLMVTAQISACSSLHPTNERCARWLLMAHDRVDSDLILLTQEFLSQMLGVRRGSVTLAASALQEAGFISYSRGHITIRNRSGLESASCECYETIERDWKNIMGYSARKESSPFGSAQVPAFSGDGSTQEHTP